jgi:hypothetical protein
MIRPRSPAQDEIDETRPTFIHSFFLLFYFTASGLGHGAPHGFCYWQRLLDIGIAPWVSYAGSAHRVVYISVWSASDGAVAVGI